MQTIIDSLLVSLTLDPKGFTKGRKETSEGFKKTRDEATATAKDLGVYGKQAASFFSSLRNEAIGLFLAFQGASSVTGFVKDLITGDAATGRLAGNIGMATNALSAWQLAVQSVGGDANDANNALAKMAEERQNFIKFGTVSDPNSFTRLGVTAEDMKNGPEAVLLKIAEASQRLDKRNFYSLAKAVGLSDGVINLLEKGRAGTQALVDEKKRDGAATDADARAAAQFQTQLAKLQAEIKNAVRPELYQLVTDLLAFNDGVRTGTIELPSLNSVLVAIGVVAAVAGAPFVALAAAIALVATNIDTLKAAWQNYQNWYDNLSSSTDPIFDPVRKALGMKTGAEARRDNTDAFGNSLGGAGTGGGGGIDDAFRRRMGAPTAAEISGAGGGRSTGNYIEDYLKQAGFSAEQAKGIHAGITAEGGGLGMAANGAFGIGQWRGARQRALFARYGRAPNIAEQMAFLVSELRGGDRGGSSVTAQTSALGTLQSYITAFMRPGTGVGGDLRRGYAALGLTAPRAPTGTGAGPSSATTTIGTIIVHTAATDAEGVARELPAAIRRRGMAMNANQGLN